MTLVMPRLMGVALFHFKLFCVWYIKRSCLGDFYTFYEKYANGGCLPQERPSWTVFCA